MVRCLADSHRYGACVGTIYCNVNPGCPTDSAAVACLVYKGRIRTTALHSHHLSKQNFNSKIFLINSPISSRIPKGSVSFSQCLIFIYYCELHWPNSFSCVFESFAAHWLGSETTHRVRDWRKLDISSCHQTTGWLWPARVSLQCFCCLLGTVWALCDGLASLSAASKACARAPHSCRANLAFHPQFLPAVSRFQHCPPRG